MDKLETPSTQSRLSANSMIIKVRRDLVNRRFHFLLWGWYVFSAFLLQVFLKSVVGYAHHYIVWLGIVPVLWITITQSKRQTKEAYTSVIADCMQYLWTGLGISFFVVSLIGNVPGKGQGVYSSFILLYGVGTFVSGRLLKFTPLVAGGIFCWGLAFACAFLPINFQMLATAAAILVSYIIPAHLLKPDVQTWKTIFRTKKALR